MCTSVIFLKAHNIALDKIITCVLKNKNMLTLKSLSYFICDIFKLKFGNLYNTEMLQTDVWLDKAIYLSTLLNVVTIINVSLAYQKHWHVIRYSPSSCTVIEIDYSVY